MKRSWLVLGVVLVSLVLILPIGAQTPTQSVLLNGGFNSDLSGWTQSGSGTFVRTTSVFHTGPGAVALTVTAPLDSNAGWQCIDLSTVLAGWPPDTNGKKYLTFNGYLKSDGSLNVRLEMLFYPNTVCGPNGQLGTSSSAYRTSSEWTLHTVTGEIPSSARSIMVYFVSGYSSPGGTFYADDLAVFSSTVNAVQSRGLTARSGSWMLLGLAGVTAVGVVLVRTRRKSAR